MANVKHLKMQFFIYLRCIAHYYKAYKGVKIYLEICGPYVTTGALVSGMLWGREGASKGWEGLN